MIIKKIAVACALLSIGALATADDYDADYLTGTWSLEGKNQCRNADAERVVLARDGAASIYNDGRLESVGFWARVDKLIQLHVVSSVHRLDPERTDFENEYSYVVIDALPIRQKKDEFEVVARVEGELEHIVLSRCP